MSIEQFDKNESINLTNKILSSVDKKRQEQDYQLDDFLADRIKSQTGSKAVKMQLVNDGEYILTSSFYDPKGSSDAKVNFKEKKITIGNAVLEFSLLNDEELAYTAHLLNAFRNFYIDKNVFFPSINKAYACVEKDVFLKYYHGSEKEEDIKDYHLQRGFSIALGYAGVGSMPKNYFIGKDAINNKYSRLKDKKNFIAFMKGCNSIVDE